MNKILLTKKFTKSRLYCTNKRHAVQFPKGRLHQKVTLGKLGHSGETRSVAYPSVRSKDPSKSFSSTDLLWRCQYLDRRTYIENTTKSKNKCIIFAIRSSTGIYLRARFLTVSEVELKLIIFSQKSFNEDELLDLKCISITGYCT